MPRSSQTPFPDMPRSSHTPFPDMPRSSQTPFPGMPRSSQTPFPGMPPSSHTPFPDMPRSSQTPLPGMPPSSQTPFPGMPRSSQTPFPGMPRSSQTPLLWRGFAQASLSSGFAHMSCESLSSCLSRLSAAIDDPAGVPGALSSLRSRHVSRTGGAELFRKRGGLALLLALFTEPSRAAILGTSRRNLELALSLLGNSCTEAGSRVQVRQLGGIPALVAILQSVCVDSVWNRVSRALGNLALDPRNCVIIHQSGAVSSLIHILQSSQDAGCLHSCLRSLRILGDSLPHRLSISKQGGLSPCASLLSSTDPALVCGAVRALCELSQGCSLDCAEQLNLAVPNLVLLAGREDVKAAVRQAALGTLCNLCSQGALRPMMGNAGLIKLLILEAGAQLSAPTRCLHLVKALCLCCREAVNRIRVRELGGLELMLNVLRDLQYRCVHPRITAAFLHFCHDTVALNLLGTGGLPGLLAQRLEELTRTAEVMGDLRETRDTTNEEDEKAASSFDFPPEKVNKRTRDSTSEDSLRSWLLSEGIVCNLEDLSPEWPLDCESRGPLVPDELTNSATSIIPSHLPSSPTASSTKFREHNVVPINRLSGAEQRSVLSPSSSHLFPSTSSPQPSHSPVQEILGAPWPLGPRVPMPSEFCRPEFPTLLLLSRFSQLSDSSSLLVCPQVLEGLLTYLTCHPHPLPRAARLLQRLTCDPSCLEAFIRTGSICTLRTRLLLCESTKRDSTDCNRHCESTKELGNLLLRNLCIQAESPFGVGTVTHLLVSGSEADRKQCALSLPFIYRKNSSQRNLLLDGALHLVLEPLICMDPVYFFNVSECLSSLLDPQKVPATCKPLVLVPSRCCYRDLMSSGAADVIFVLDGGERVEGNRKEVTGGCEVFKAMLEGCYAESRQREILVQKMPPCAFTPLLHYLHGCTIESRCPTLYELPLPTPDQELSHSPLGLTLAAAGQFLLPGLQRELEVSVMDRLLSLENLPSVYSFAEMHGTSELRRDCCLFLLKMHHPPQKRAFSLFQLYQRAHDKQRLSLIIENIVQEKD
ncbi:armadillo repeat-containing 5 [Pelobates cultripes]|nr:armadillo repeat-containing 5 [Pelobates cultripes]